MRKDSVYLIDCVIKYSNQKTQIRGLNFLEWHNRLLPKGNAPHRQGQAQA
jgi:hypothetical protein